jgi:hypothetical protein
MSRIIASWPLIAFGLLAIGYGTAAIQGRLSYGFYSAVLVAGGICAGGFGAWIVPWLRRIWRSAMGKLVLAWLHAIAVVVALIPAQALVAQALELPPQDFEITVALCAVVLFLPIVWIHIFLLPMAVLSLLLFIVFVGAALVNTVLGSGVWEVLIGFLEQTFPTEASRLRRMVEHGRSRSTDLAWNSMGCGLGAFMLLFVAAVAQEQYPHAKAYLTPIVRGVAYIGDYQPIPNYPGIDGHRRARVHENGVVSYAEEQGWDIHISVDTVRPQTSSRQTDVVE